MKDKQMFIAPGLVALGMGFQGARMLGFLATEVPTPVGVLLFLGLSPTGETIRLIVEHINRRRPNGKTGE